MSTTPTIEEFYLGLMEYRARLVGKRVRLDYTSDRYTRLRPGTEGIVTHVDVMWTVHVKWDDGSTLGLIEDEGDRFTVIG